jgi:16S rRNA processing protein RimM
MAERILVAQIGAPHGIRGEVRLWSFTESPMAVKDYGALESEDGTQTFAIEALRPGKDFLVARLAGVSDRAAAERLRNLKLYVPRDRLPAPEDGDTFYHADLIGLAAVAIDGRTLGTVCAVHDFGAGNLIEVLASGARVMLPFTDAVVPEVDLAAGRLIVDPPEGTFDHGIAEPQSTPAVWGSACPGLDPGSVRSAGSGVKNKSRHKDRAPALRHKGSAID